jgi:5-methylcytosine-specific restriction endonuclease McrA
MVHALVLNATYEPLCVVTQRRALLLVLARKAVPLELSATVLHSATASVSAPTVVRLVRFVKVPFHGHVPLTRRALFARDGGRCAYCGATAATIDHVVPRSRGGRHEWTNVVSACHRCNHLKADRPITELGLAAAGRAEGPERCRLADHRHRSLRPELGAVPRGLRRGGAAGRGHRLS